jgi:hypothetical protein
VDAQAQARRAANAAVREVGIELIRVISGRLQISRQIRRQRMRQMKWQT